MAAKEAIQYAFDGLGGADALVAWAKKNDDNKRVFYGQIYPKLLPLDVKHSGEIRSKIVQVNLPTKDKHAGATAGAPIVPG